MYQMERGCPLSLTYREVLRIKRVLSFDKDLVNVRSCQSFVPATTTRLNGHFIEDRSTYFADDRKLVMRVEHEASFPDKETFHA